MSDIVVNVTNAGAANVAVSNGSTVNAVVGSGGSVNVALGSISPGNATVVSGTLTINSTTTLAAGTPAYVVNNGTAYAAKIDIGIPAGPATNVTVGKVSTLSAGSNATVTGTTNGATLTLNFGVPAGASGTNGINGANGITPSFSIGKVSTLAAGSSANVTLTTANSGANVTLDFGIPAGADGAAGSGSVSLSNATPSNLGTASAGSSNLASRSDHVHSLPVISYANLTGTPSNFPTNATLVSGLSSATVSSVNNLTGALTLAAGANVTLTTNGSTLTLSSAGGLGADDAVDGGNYVGEILAGITFLTQPQSQTLSLSTAVSLSQQFTPSGFATRDVITPLHVTSYGGRLIAGRVSTGQNNLNSADLIASSDNGYSWTQYMCLSTPQSIDFRSSFPPRFASNGTRAVFTTGMSGFGSEGFEISSLRYVSQASVGSSSITSVASGDSGIYGGHDIAYLAAAGRFVVITTRFVSSSSSAEAWTTRNDNVNRSYNLRIFSVGSRFVVVPGESNQDITPGQTYEPRLMHSTDGVSWTTVVRSYGYSSAASNGNRIVAVRSNSSSVDYSLDGLLWSSATLPVQCNHVVHAAGLFWAFRGPPAADNADVCTSPDGVAWTLRELPQPASLMSGASAAENTAFFSIGSWRPLGVVANVSASTASANLTVLASAGSGNPVAYQWQRSLDAGGTWGNVANATSTTLALAGLTAADNGTRYRASVSAVGSSTQPSQSATLTITG